ncbi:chemotaxis protein CheE [Brevundimonas sp. NIBR11]|uniref:chemotaxis protein CheE n=1 Tax=Brevundimonas sp. NIBR11 TaxID=3015999 RepID=UPI0022F07B95|nr:chemotaxis protein CheE [Brevundimonas sp. NIBR11]
MSEPGGRRVQDLERNADAALEVHRDDAMAMVSGTLGLLEEACAEAAPDAGPRVYQLASSIVDLAGFFDTGPLFEAAYSLCDISDRMIQTEAWHWPSVQVHAQALRLILAGGCRTGVTSGALLAGLKSIAQCR